MKIAAASKTNIIYEKNELIRHFRQLLNADSQLEWRLPSFESTQNGPPWVEFKLDRKKYRFTPLYSLRPSIAELESVLTKGSKGPPPILIAPELTARVLDFCREREVAAMDLNGRVFLRAEGLLVDRAPIDGRDFRFELEPRNPFVGKSGRIVRSLLTDRDRIWKQAELVERARASAGLVSRIVQHLLSQGFLEKHSAREYRITDPLGLIDAWVKADEFKRRASTRRFTVFTGNPIDLARELNRWAETQSVRIAFTQWIGAWLRHPYTEPIITSAYVERLPENATLEALSIREVTEAGKIWLHIPDEEGVFLEGQKIQGLPIVSDAQIYLDLQRTELRGPDQANALRAWEGFCRR